MEMEMEGTEALTRRLRARGYSAETDSSCVRIPADEIPLESLEDAQVVQDHGFRALGFEDGHYVYVPEGDR